MDSLTLFQIKNLISDVIKPNWDKHNVNLAQLIADYALKIGKSTDNVTVITVRANPHTTQMELQQSASLSTQPL